MSYFNKKFDVLNIKLTPYGRHLLQNGKLMPKYYAFFDDDVVYDAASAGFAEKNSDTKSRIIEDTPVLKPHYLFKNLEDAIGKDQPFPTTQHDKIKKPSADETSKFLQYSLGSSDPTKEKAPAWNLAMLKNEISSSSSQLVSSNYQNVNIPQMELEINYTMSVDNMSNLTAERGMNSTPSLQVSKVYDDGTFLNVEDEQVLLQLLEDNAFLYGDSLELEVFMYEVTGSATAGTLSYTEELIPLKFVKREEQIKNDILVSETADDFRLSDDIGKITAQNVEYYFDCRLDKEIPLKDLCDGLKNLKSLGLDLDIECPDDMPSGASIYSSDISDDDIEDC